MVDQDNEPLLVPSKPGWYWAKWKSDNHKWMVVFVSADLFARVDGGHCIVDDLEWYAPAGTVESLEEPPS